MHYLLFNSEITIDDAEIDLGKIFYSFLAVYAPIAEEIDLYRTIPNYQENKPFCRVAMPDNIRLKRGITIAKNGYLKIIKMYDE